jgi:uncharacterized surface protein with fasciclin (FAS1) repeats
MGRHLILHTALASILLGAGLFSCSQSSDTKGSSPESSNAGQSLVEDSGSAKNIIQVAMGSKDHTTLVAALKAADLVDVLANPGPFTVFAPTNAAFDKLPPGTVTALLKPEKKSALQNILQYHVSLGVLKLASFKDGEVLGQVNGDSATITLKNGQVMINGAKIIASIPTSNGMIHVIDAVLLPPEKK